jgi:phosphonate degradation associated HDIG domain protein
MADEQGQGMARDIVAELVDLIDGKGHRQYGLSHINQRAHALQAALLAEQAGCSAALITASLLHDIGHMVHDLGEDPAARGIDDRHEELGQVYLQQHFGPEVTEPVRLHVAAKRYLCATEADYFARLSSDSVRSLELQGGPMSADEVAAFRAVPHAMDAVQLRRFDEGAKVKGLQTPPTTHFMPHLRACLRAG